MSWLTWFGRWRERDHAYARLTALRQSYSEYGERVIKLSARTDLARKSAGSTQRAFDFVERTFARATDAYSKVGEQIARIEESLGKGVVAYFPEADRALKEVGPLLDELERQLAAWESHWQQVPREIDEIAGALASVRQQLETASAAVGAPLPPEERLTTAESFLERIRRTQAEGNPVEARHQVEDLRIALQKLTEEVGLYQSGAGAVAQAERDLARVRELAAATAGAPTDAVTALAGAEALLARLRPNLIAGKLDHFQADLLEIQRQLSAAREALRR